MSSKGNFFKKYFTNQGQYPKEMNFYIKQMWQIYAGLLAVILLFFILLLSVFLERCPHSKISRILKAIWTHSFIGDGNV